MQPTKAKRRRRRPGPAHKAAAEPAAFPLATVINGRNYFLWDGDVLIPGPKLRAKLGVSAVTLWRWRHRKSTCGPAPNVTAWLAQQPVAA